MSAPEPSPGRHSRRVPAHRVLRRATAAGSLVAAVTAVVVAIAISAHHRAHTPATTTAAHTKATSHSDGSGAGTKSTGQPGTGSVPILAYEVINSAPPSTSSPQLYVPLSEFTAQMQALKAAGWHAVTLDQVAAYWAHGTTLGSGKPIVISFDTGYASQYNNALPVMRSLGWVGVENLELNGLPPSEGGLTDAQIRGLVSAGWELDSEGMGQPDLVGLGPSTVQAEATSARQSERSAYGVAADWFNYPSGAYDQTVAAAVKAAGFVGATTAIPGWAQANDNRYALPRIRVLPGTSPSALLSQIASAQGDSPPPPSSNAGPGG